MWTIDAQCPRCCKKDRCDDRKEIIQNLSNLTGKLNTDPASFASPGDGTIIVACQDFAIAK